MDEILRGAASQGLYLVSDDNTTALLKEFESQLVEAEKLCAVNDPETTPYVSKYKARELIDGVCQKLEATKTIATLEKNTRLVNEMQCKLAEARVRTGLISWECEEPHNAQTDLEMAASYYCPKFLGTANELGGEEVEDSVNVKEFDTNSCKIPVDLIASNQVVNAMKCLNMLGILWAGRSQVKKSFIFLLAANSLYANAEQSTASDQARRKDLDNVYTHNLFYLAQAYGHIGDAQSSCVYCQETLQRQLSCGFDSARAALQWSKNCAGLADFYLAMRKYKATCLVLSSAELVLQRQVFVDLASSASSPSPALSASDSVSGDTADASLASSSSVRKTDQLATDAIELEADLHRRWARLDIAVMKKAVELASLQSLSLEDNQELPDDLPQGKEHVFSFGQATVKSETELFTGLQAQLLDHLSPRQLGTFEQARIVYLRANAHLEAAKSHFRLDGYVTDHVTLLQEQSQLFHFLASFESDTKRKLAMETRRVDLLQPLLKLLNKSAFEVLHKQIAYELGETYMALLEIKLDKFKARGDRSGDIDMKSLKKVEIEKVNSYCRGALAMFRHFCSLYGRAPERRDNVLSPFEDMPLAELTTEAASCPLPDESLVSDEEVRHYLNAHFLSARILSKIMAPTPKQPCPWAPKAQSKYVISSLKVYEWLSKYARHLCEQKQISVNDVFKQEVLICDEMTKLLPSKIDRMHHHGEMF